VLSIIVNNVDEQMLLYLIHVPNKIQKLRILFEFKYKTKPTRKICKRSSRIFLCPSSKSSDERSFSITEQKAVKAATRI
jgi:hypothetical protein